MIERFEGTMTVKSPLHHAGDEKTGSSPILRSIYVYSHDKQRKVPYISGNGIRGKLRRLLMYDYLERLGVAISDLDPKLYHVLFTGGMLEQGDSTLAIDLEQRKQLRDGIPPLALIGCAYGNQMLPGVLKVGHGFPVCAEYAPMLPPDLASRSEATRPVREFTDGAFQTRRDDLQAAREKDEQAHQMKVEFECFVPGTVLTHWFLLEHANELIRSCFGRMMELFAASPFLGGKSGTGHGEVLCNYEPEWPDSREYGRFMSEDIAVAREALAVLQQALKIK